MRRLFIHAWIISMEEEDPCFRGALGINGKTIDYVGSVPPEKVMDAYDEVIDLKYKQAILPGFVNTHGHAAMSLLRGYADDLPLQEWLEEKMWPIEGRFTEYQVRAGTQLSVLEMLKSGTTCFLDMYDRMDVVGEVVLDAGMRASLCRGAIGFGTEELRKRKLEEAVKFALDWKGAGDGRISTMLAPHSPYTCDPQYLKRFIEKAIEHRIPLHTHMSETSREVAQNVEEYGKRPVEHLQKLGFFDPPSLVAHAVHVNDEEIEILAEYDVKISHYPGSNLKLGSGIAPIGRMMEKGIRPSLGTDSAASNNNLDMLEEVRLAALIHKGVHEDPEVVSATTALKMGTLYGAEALFLEDQIGSLEVGKRADFITMNLTGAHMYPMHHLISQIVYAASIKDVSDVFIDGKQVVKKGECLTLDEEKICHEATRAFEALKP